MIFSRPYQRRHSRKHPKQIDIEPRFPQRQFAFPRPCRIDFPGQCGKFGRLVHLRGEQQVLLATVINRVAAGTCSADRHQARQPGVRAASSISRAAGSRGASQASCLAFSRSARSRFDREHLAQGHEFIRVRQICHGVHPLYAADRQLAGSKSQKLICGGRRLNFRLHQFILCAPEYWWAIQFGAQRIERHPERHDFALW